MAVATKKLTRGKDRMLLGVCSGIADYMNVDVTLVRIGYVLLTAFTGFVLGIVGYFVAALVMPDKA